MEQNNNPDLELIDEKTDEYVEMLKGRISPNVAPDIAKKMIDFALTPEDYQRTLEKIRAFCFTGKFPVDEPIFHVVTSQTGGGKSGLTASILKHNPNIPVIDSDAYKAFNPKKEKIAILYPTLYGHFTGLDAYMHRDDIFNDIIQNRYNGLIEMAPSVKDGLFIDIDRLIAEGYKVVVNVLAVSRINSMLSIHERYEGQIEALMDAPKLTDFRRANDSYDAVSVVLEDILKKPEIDVIVWRRGTAAENVDKNYVPEPVIVTTDRNQALKALEDARKEDEQKTLLTARSRLEVLKSQMEARNAPTEQRAQLSAVEKIIDEAEKKAKLGNK